jgi:hypothetical protein
VEHLGGPVPMRTAQNLLESAYEDEQFEYCFNAGLARVDLSGKLQRYPICMA